MDAKNNKFYFKSGKKMFTLMRIANMLQTFLGKYFMAMRTKKKEQYIVSNVNIISDFRKRTTCTERKHNLIVRRHLRDISGFKSSHGIFCSIS